MYVCVYDITHNKNKILPFATTWMGLEGNVVTEIRQRNKLLFDITCI